MASSHSFVQLASLVFTLSVVFKLAGAQTIPCEDIIEQCGTYASSCSYTFGINKYACVFTENSSPGGDGTSPYTTRQTFTPATGATNFQFQVDSGNGAKSVEGTANKYNAGLGASHNFTLAENQLTLPSGLLLYVGHDGDTVPQGDGTGAPAYTTDVAASRETPQNVGPASGAGGSAGGASTIQGGSAGGMISFLGFIQQTSNGNTQGFYAVSGAGGASAFTGNGGNAGLLTQSVTSALGSHGINAEGSGTEEAPGSGEGTGSGGTGTGANAVSGNNAVSPGVAGAGATYIQVNDRRKRQNTAYPAIYGGGGGGAGFSGLTSTGTSNSNTAVNGGGGGGAISTINAMQQGAPGAGGASYVNPNVFALAGSGGFRTSAAPQIIASYTPAVTPPLPITPSMRVRARGILSRRSQRLRQRALRERMFM